MRRYRGKDEAFLFEKFNLDGFIKKFGRVEDFDEMAEHGDWTFWTYARRAASVMGPRGNCIFDQLKRQRALVKKWSEKAIHDALHKRGRHGGADFHAGVTVLDGYDIEHL